LLVKIAGTPVLVIRGMIAVIAAGVLLTGCGGGDSNPAASSSSTTTTTTTSANKAIANWGVDALRPSLDRIGNALTWIGGALKNLDLADSRAGCRELNNGASQLEEKLPAPDPQLTSLVASVIENLRDYSHTCQGLNPASTDADFAELKRYQDRATTDMEKAVLIVKAAQRAS